MSKNEQEIAFNSTYKKLVVHRLNAVLRFVQSFVVADCFVLRNRQLLVTANRYRQILNNNTLYKGRARRVSRRSAGSAWYACRADQPRSGSREARATWRVRGRSYRTRQGLRRTTPSHGGEDVPSAADRYSRAALHRALPGTGDPGFRRSSAALQAPQVRPGKKTSRGRRSPWPSPS